MNRFSLLAYDACVIVPSDPAQIGSCITGVVRSSIVRLDTPMNSTIDHVCAMVHASRLVETLAEAGDDS